MPAAATMCINGVIETVGTKDFTDIISASLLRASDVEKKDWSHYTTQELSIRKFILLNRIEHEYDFKMLYNSIIYQDLLKNVLQTKSKIGNFEKHTRPHYFLGKYEWSADGYRKLLKHESETTVKHMVEQLVREMQDALVIAYSVA